MNHIKYLYGSLIIIFNVIFCVALGMIATKLIENGITVGGNPISLLGGFVIIAGTVLFQIKIIVPSVQKVLE